MSMIDPDKVSAIIREVAEEKIVPRFRQLKESEIRSKTTPTDLVTVADEEAEEELTRRLSALLPGSAVVGEEAVSKGLVSRDILQDHTATVWVVDPVDGTGNFANGNPVYGTMVSLVHKGERVGGWIYQIPRNKMVVAEKGAGVMIDGASYAAAPLPLPPSGFRDVRGFLSKKFIPPVIRPQIDRATDGMKHVKTYMCCAWEYVALLKGEASFSFYKRIEPWDHLAGTLIVEEAGFMVRHWSGERYTPGNLEGGLISASSEELWTRIADAFVKFSDVRRRRGARE